MSANRANPGSLAIIAVFLLLLVMPLIQMAYPFVPIRPLDENRVLSPAPRWRDIAHPAAFTATLQRWFQDHYGFRDMLIRLQTQLDYSIFSTSDKIHIGRDGWLYYRDEIDRAEPQIEAMSDGDLDQTVASFTRLRDWLGVRDIHLVLLTIQQKDRFYPEFLPRTAERARDRHRFDDFRARMHAVPGITYLDTTETLLRVKQQRPIFPKTDFHWNEPAAFVLAGELVDAIAAVEFRPTPMWHYTLTIDQHDFSGGQARFMPLFKPPHEQALFVHRTWPDAGHTTITNQEPFELITKAPAGSNLLAPSVVYADSFFDRMVVCGLPDYFQSMYPRPDEDEPVWNNAGAACDPNRYEDLHLRVHRDVAAAFPHDPAP